MTVMRDITTPAQPHPDAMVGRTITQGASPRLLLLLLVAATAASAGSLAPTLPALEQTAPRLVVRAENDLLKELKSEQKLEVNETSSALTEPRSTDWKDEAGRDVLEINPEGNLLPAPPADLLLELAEGIQEGVPPPDRFTRAVLNSPPAGQGLQGNFPTLSKIPRTDFNCNGRIPGYYADESTACQVFHVCHSDTRKDSFLCPNGTIFHQLRLVCDWWYNVECADSSLHEDVNADIGKEWPRHDGGRNNNALDTSQREGRKFGPVVNLPGGTGITGQTFSLGSHIPAIPTGPTLPQVDNFVGGSVGQSNQGQFGGTGRLHQAVASTTSAPTFASDRQNQFSSAVTPSRATFNNIQTTPSRQTTRARQQTEQTLISTPQEFQEQIQQQQQQFQQPIQQQQTGRPLSSTQQQFQLPIQQQQAGRPLSSTQQQFQQPIQQQQQQTGRPLISTTQHQLQFQQPNQFNQPKAGNNNNNLNNIQSFGKPLSQTHSFGDNVIDDTFTTVTLSPTTVAQQHQQHNQQRQRSSFGRSLPTTPFVSATTQRPVITTQRPVITTQRPVITTQRPVVTTLAAPAITTRRPPVTQRLQTITQGLGSSGATLSTGSRNRGQPLATVTGRPLPASQRSRGRQQELSSVTGRPLPVSTTVIRPQGSTTAGRKGPTLTKVFRKPLGQATTPIRPGSGVNTGFAPQNNVNSFTVRLDDSNELDDDFNDVSDELLLIRGGNPGVGLSNSFQAQRRPNNIRTTQTPAFNTGSPGSVPNILSPIANRNRNRLNNQKDQALDNTGPQSNVPTTINDVQNQANQAFGIPLPNSAPRNFHNNNAGVSTNFGNNQLSQGVGEVAISPNAGVLSADVVRQQHEKRILEHQEKLAKLKQAFQQQKVADSQAQQARRPGGVARLSSPDLNSVLAFVNSIGASPLGARPLGPLGATPLGPNSNFLGASAGRPLPVNNNNNNNVGGGRPLPNSNNLVNTGAGRQVPTANNQASTVAGRPLVTTSRPVSVPAQRFTPPPLQHSSPGVEQLHDRRSHQNLQRQQQLQQQQVHQQNLILNQQQHRHELNTQNLNQQQQRINKQQQHNILRQQQQIEKQNHKIETQQQQNTRRRQQQQQGNVGVPLPIINNNNNNNNINRNRGSQRTGNPSIGQPAVVGPLTVRLDDDDDVDDRFDGDDHFNDDLLDDLDDLNDPFDLDDRFDDDRFKKNTRFGSDARFDDDRFDLDDPFDDDRFDLDDDLDDSLEDLLVKNATPRGGSFTLRPTPRFNRQSGNGGTNPQSGGPSPGDVQPPSETFLPPPPPSLPSEAKS